MTIHAYNTDCMNLFRQLPNECIDLCVSDVPYRVISGGSGTEGDGSPTGVIGKNDGKIFKHNHIKFERWLPELYRVMKSGTHTYLMINWDNLMRLTTACRMVGFHVHHPLIWVKDNKTPSRYGMKQFEFIVMCAKGKSPTINDVNGQMGSNILQYANVRGKQHPTQKPVELMRDLILRSSKPHQCVLDPFFGTGATLHAADAECRNAIGSEIDPHYFNIWENAQ